MPRVRFAVCHVCRVPCAVSHVPCAVSHVRRCACAPAFTCVRMLPALRDPPPVVSRCARALRCSGPGVGVEEAAALATSGLPHLDPRDYGALLTAAGFVDVTVHDRTHLLVQTLAADLARLRGAGKRFAAEFTAGELKGLESVIEGRLARCVVAVVVLGVSV